MSRIAKNGHNLFNANWTDRKKQLQNEANSFPYQCICLTSHMRIPYRVRQRILCVHSGHTFLQREMRTNTRARQHHSLTKTCAHDACRADTTSIWHSLAITLAVGDDCAETYPREQVRTHTLIALVKCGCVHVCA